MFDLRQPSAVLSAGTAQTSSHLNRVAARTANPAAHASSTSVGVTAPAEPMPRQVIAVETVDGLPYRNDERELLTEGDAG